MKRSEKELLFSTLTLYLFSIIVIFVFILEVVRVIGFTPENLMIAMALSFIIALGFGYLIAKHGIAFSISTHAMLRKLTKNILHELNIPVSTIKGNVHLLKRKLDNETALLRLERIEKAGDNLIELYQEMEYVIRKEIKAVEKEEVELASFVKERLELFEGVREGIVIKTALNPCRIVVDLQGLKHAFDNLVTNAIKYNKENGMVLISIKENRLTVQDEGMGIEADKMAYIFNRYYQEDATQKGEGIGLSLVKSFCDEEKIDIKFSSKKDEGTVFILDFTAVVVSSA